MAMAADDPAALIQAGRKAAAANDSAGATANFTKAMEILPPTDARFSAAAVEYANFLRQSKAVNKAEAVLKSATEKQTAAKAEPLTRVPVVMALIETESMLRNVPAVEAGQNELVEIWRLAAPGQPVVANNLTRLAVTLEREMKFDPAAKAIQEALTILTKVYGPNDPTVGYAMGTLSRLKMRLTQRDEAMDLAKQARVIMEKTVDPKSYPVGNGVAAPRIVAKKEPALSEEARKGKIQGDLLLSLVIGDDGMPRDIHVLIPLGAGMDEKAVEAVKQWRFEAGTKNDEPVAVRANLDINVRIL